MSFITNFLTAKGNPGGGGSGGRPAVPAGVPEPFRPPRDSPLLPAFIKKMHFPIPPPAADGRTGYHLFGKAYVDPNHFKLEMLFALFGLAYLGWYLLVRQRNRSRAYAWTREALKELHDEFANVADGPTPHGTGPLVWNGANEAVLYATGRRNVDSFHAFFQFTPLHDPIYLLVSGAINTMAGPGTMQVHDRDQLILSFTLPLLGNPNETNPSPTENLCGVFALIDKSCLRHTKSAARYDLTFGKLLEAAGSSTQRGLDERWAILSENADLTDAYLGEAGDKGQAQRERVGIAKALQEGGEASKWLESLVISDQPLTKPEAPVLPMDRHRRVMLTLRIPSNASQARQTLPLLALALDLVDALSPSTSSSPLAFRSDTLGRLKRTRTEMDRQLFEEYQREKKEAEKERAEKEKAKAAKAKLEGMSEKEIERRKEVERKRQLKKQQSRTLKR